MSLLSPSLFRSRSLSLCSFFLFLSIYLSLSLSYTHTNTLQGVVVDVDVDVVILNKNTGVTVRGGSVDIESIESPRQIGVNRPPRDRKARRDRR